jgi:hypothetical protein
MSDPAHNGRVPFLVRYMQAIPKVHGFPYRFDRSRQIGQVMVDHQWVDALDAPQLPDRTKLTEVRRETTDD